MRPTPGELADRAMRHPRSAPLPAKSAPQLERELEVAYGFLGRAVLVLMQDDALWEQWQEENRKAREEANA